MWTVATYQPTTFFSLRPALSTSSGGQTLVMPTPFALKMALLDVAIRGWGLARAVEWFPTLRDLQVAIAGPPWLIINNTFIKIQRLKKNGPSDRDGTGLVGPLGSTIAFRAFVQFGGPLYIAVAPGDTLIAPVKGTRGRQVIVTPPIAVPLSALLAQINYLGKRGGFLQLQAQPQTLTGLDEHPMDNFTLLNGAVLADFPLEGLMQVVDDCSPTLEFAQINVYDSKALQVGKDRLLRHVALPYRLARSSQRNQLYQHL